MRTLKTGISHLELSNSRQIVPDKVLFLECAQAAGYFVRLFFVGTSAPTINAARVARRVMEGGHSVPIEKIISRHSKSLANLAVALTFADRVYIYDNSLKGQEARLCARTRDGVLYKVYGESPAWVTDALRDLPNHA